jgi:hypothetical protein
LSGRAVLQMTGDDLNDDHTKVGCVRLMCTTLAV